ncbi:MAG: oligopeptide transport system substrate-binding protein, partial [Actinomycetota bacterium]|nr:oligopeptide transport system substrate-binding protein [Actinomycetota bacterium]
AMATKRTVGAVVALLLLLGACSSGDDKTDSSPSPAEGASGGTFSIYNGEPEHLSPPLDYESAGSQVFEALWTPLVTLDAEGNVEMAQAESVESDDQKVWTIKIKPGWTFHNGDPVTAQDYVDTWNWTALGENGAILNFFFERFEGYDDLNPAEGKAKTKELSGLKVIDDTTFEVTLNDAFSQFPLQLAFTAFVPMPKAFFDDQEAFDEAPIGDGPYMMDGKWKHNDTINLKRYEDYPGTPGFADEIKLPIYNATGPAYADLQGGTLDIDIIGSDKLVQAEKDFPDTLQRNTGATLLYLSFPLYDKRFESKYLRQALSLAVDRQAVMNAILVAETPADSFITPAIPGYREASCKYCHLDVELAKQKLEQAGGWEGPLTIHLYEDQALEQAMEAVANQWKQNLGIEDIEIDPININSYFDFYDSKKAKGPWWDGWTEDYPSMEDFLRPIMGANGGYNESTYSNPEFDALLEEGDKASSTEESIAKYQAAEDIVAEDMPIMPWGYIGYNWATSDRVTNVQKDGPFDLVALEKVQVVNP